MPFVSGPKERKSRSLGENLFIKAERSASQKSAMVRRAFPPGMHGKRRRNLSEYALQLREKQKLRFFYGLQEKRMKDYVSLARKSKKISASEFLFRVLELRLDSAVFRSGLAPSRSVSRQMVTHGHLTLNGRKVNIPSISLKPGDVVFAAEASRSKKIFEKSLEWVANTSLPAWLESEKGGWGFKLKQLPILEDEKANFKLPLVIEYYSR